MIARFSSVSRRYAVVLSLILALCLVSCSSAMPLNLTGQGAPPLPLYGEMVSLNPGTSLRFIESCIQAAPGTEIYMKQIGNDTYFIFAKSWEGGKAVVGAVNGTHIELTKLASVRGNWMNTSTWASLRDELVHPSSGWVKTNPTALAYIFRDMVTLSIAHVAGKLAAIQPSIMLIPAIPALFDLPVSPEINT